MSKRPFVYMLASAPRGTLYVGVTGALRLRLLEHRNGLGAGFTRRFRVTRLVWFEEHPDFGSAIARETAIKRWRRAWKLKLVEDANPGWVDLWSAIADDESLGVRR